MGNELSVCDPCCTPPSSMKQMDNRLMMKTQNNTEAREDPHLKSANGKASHNKLQEQGDILSHASSCQSFTEMSPSTCTSPRPRPSPPHPKQQVEAAAGGTIGCEGGGSTPFSPFSGILHFSTSLETSAAIRAAPTSAPTPLASASPSHRQKNKGAAGVHSEYSAIVSTHTRHLLSIPVRIAPLAPSTASENGCSYDS